MSIAVFVVVALLAPLQSPPPAPLDAPPATATPPAADPAATTPPTPPAATPAATTPAPEATTTPETKKLRRPPPDREPSGMDTVPTAGAQLAAGTGACCVGVGVSCCIALPFAFVPVVGPILGSIFGNAAAGALIGGSEAFVGDFAGRNRGALLWPVLTSSGILIAGGLAAVGATIALGIAPLDPNNPGAYLAASAVPLGISVATTVAAIVAPVIVYQMTSVPKEPGDQGGFGMPGIMKPADPTGTREERAREQAAPTPAPSTPSSSTPPPLETPQF